MYNWDRFGEFGNTPSTLVQLMKATVGSGGEVWVLSCLFGGKGISGSRECSGVVDGRVERTVWEQLTSISPSTPVQPLEATVGSGDTSSMLLRIVDGKGRERRFVRLESKSSTPVQLVKATIVSGDRRKFRPGNVNSKGL